MRRRDLLARATATFALLLTGKRVLAALTPAKVQPARRRRPSDPDWPNTGQWRQLNEDVHGNLLTGAPLLATCMEDVRSADCVETMSRLRNPFFLGDQPGGTQVSGWLDAWIPTPSAYVLKANSTADVVAGAFDNNKCFS